MTVGVEYAKALYSLADELDLTDLFLEELGRVRLVLEENPSYIKLLDTPALKKDEKLRLIDEAFSSLSEYILNTLKLLCCARSVGCIPDIMREYISLYDKAHNITRVDVITALAMTESQIERMKGNLAAELNSKIVLNHKVDKTILGGVILRYSGTQTDASIRSRLDAISTRIKETII